MTQRTRHSRYRQNPRKSIIEVVLIDIEPCLQELHRKLKEAGRIKDSITKLTVWSDNLGYVDTTEGLYFLNYEAISATNDESPLTEEGNVQELPVYYHEEGTISMMPSANLKITRDLLLGFPTKGRVNFADWVKTFGARLEDNFDNWNEYLEPIYVSPETGDGD